MKPLKTVSITEVVTTVVDVAYQPCLECDSDNIAFHDISTVGSRLAHFVGACQACSNSTLRYLTKREAVDNWNKQNDVDGLIAEALTERLRLHHRIDTLRNIQAMRASK